MCLTFNAILFKLVKEAVLVYLAEVSVYDGVVVLYGEAEVRIVRRVAGDA